MVISHSILFRGLTSAVVNEMCVEALRTSAGTAVANMQYGEGLGDCALVFEWFFPREG